MHDDQRRALDIARVMRDVIPYAEHTYTNGGCFQFYRILKAAIPNAEAWYDGNHVITMVYGRTYDITGEVPITTHYPMKKTEPAIYREAHEWSPW